MTRWKRKIDLSRFITTFTWANGIMNWDRKTGKYVFADEWSEVKIKMLNNKRLFIIHRWVCWVFLECAVSFSKQDATSKWSIYAVSEFEREIDLLRSEKCLWLIGKNGFAISAFSGEWEEWICGWTRGDKWCFFLWLCFMDQVFAFQANERKCEAYSNSCHDKGNEETKYGFRKLWNWRRWKVIECKGERELSRRKASKEVVHLFMFRDVSFKASTSRKLKN